MLGAICQQYTTQVQQQRGTPSTMQQQQLMRSRLSAAARPLPRRAPPRVRAAAAATATVAKPAAFEVMGGNVPRGDTAGAIMVVENVTIQAGERDLMTDIDWRLMAGHRVGLVGANGAGKSTLLRAMAGMRTVSFCCWDGAASGGWQGLVGGSAVG
jgi:ATP-binding cassette subfamily F protein uup